MLTSALEKKNSNILDDGTPSVLCHTMKTPVNFMRRFRSINA